MTQDKLKDKVRTELPQVITVRQFAEVLGLPVTRVIAKLLELGIKATINESIDFETAQVAGDELGFEIVPKEQVKEVAIHRSGNLKPRPPIVTVMGHVDHGKTQLLDTIRQTDVISKEAGGITQGIGAYQVAIGGRRITFLDTPGHEAFSAIRAHGANITDIVVLVIAADEGVKPQTLEAISHARAANVPIIVAINKIDLPTADPEKVKRQITEHNLVPEEYGGKTPVALISAKTGQGSRELLDLISLVADLKEFKADPTIAASGIVVESHVKTGFGPVATCLPIQGTLRVGDIVVVGSTWGKIRTLNDWVTTNLREVPPAKPVQISGLKALPHFADLFQVVASEREAKELASKRLRQVAVHRLTRGLGEVSGEVKEGRTSEIKLVVKADLVGSLEALKQSIEQINVPGVKLTIVHQAVGAVNESDVNLADASGALIIAFRVGASAPVVKLADLKAIEVKTYQVIYHLIDDLKTAATGKLEPEIVETPLGRFKVIKSFFQIKDEAVIGGQLEKGTLEVGIEARVIRNDKQVGKIRINSIKLGDATVDQAQAGKQYGLKIVKLPGDKFRVRPGDMLDCYKLQKILKHGDENNS